jgi:hypothetical protein
MHNPCINSIIVSSTCFEHPSVHPQEGLFLQFYGISVMHPYKQSGRWQNMFDEAHPAIAQTDYRDA